MTKNAPRSTPGVAQWQLALALLAMPLVIVPAHAQAPSADLAVGIVDHPDPAVVLSNVTYLISVTNFGPSASTGVSLSASLPAGANVISTNATQGVGSISGTALTWDLGTMDSGAKATLTIVVGTTASDTLTLSATVTGSESDPDPANNSATATTLVTTPFVSIAAATANLTYESGPANGAVDPGETVTTVLRLLNIGNIRTSNLVGTLLTNDGVTPVPPNNSQTYAILSPSGFAVGRAFSFTAHGTNGQTITATLRLHDGTNTYPDVNFSFTLPNTQSFASVDNIVIPDPAASPPYSFESGPANPYPSVIAVSNLTGVLGKVTVTLSNLSHTYPRDINVLLAGPNGAKALLMSHVGDQSVTGLNLTLDDSAPSPLPASGQLLSGVWQPAVYDVAPGFPTNAPAGPYAPALSTFNGSSPNGTWSLYIFDDGAGGAGHLAGGWSLALSMITPVNPLADLGLNAVGTPHPALVGAPLTYTFTIFNHGPNVASDVFFTNTVLAGMTLVSASPSQGYAITSANTVLGELGPLNPGAAATVTVMVVPTSSTIPPGASTALLTNTASVGAVELDLDPGNNSALTTTTVLWPAIQGDSLINGQLRLSVTAVPGLNYAIQASTDLTSWVSLTTNPASLEGTILFVDTNSPGFEQRFYRTKCLAP